MHFQFILVQSCDWQAEADVKVPSVDHTRVGIGVYQPATGHRYK